MTKIELNIKKIAQIAKEKEEKNFDFRAYLKGQDSKEIDKIVHRLHQEITSQIDCGECGNCCINLCPLLLEKEIKKLSDIEKMTQEEFIQSFVETDTSENTKYLKASPCRYLVNRKCNIYKDRPNDCKSYPHTHKVDFISRTLGVIDNYEICPIVYNLYEQLKFELEYEC